MQPRPHDRVSVDREEEPPMHSPMRRRFDRRPRAPRRRRDLPRAEAQDRARAKEYHRPSPRSPARSCPTPSSTGRPTTSRAHERPPGRPRQQGYKPAPMLATGWKIVNDTTWEFTLNQGVKFHNGEPFNAALRQGDDGLHQGPGEQVPLCRRALAQVKDVQVVNDYTVRFITDKPWPGLIDRMAAHRFPAHAAQGAEGARRPGARRQADRHRPLQVRPVGAGREAGHREEPRLLAGPRRTRTA